MIIWNTCADENAYNSVRYDALLQVEETGMSAEYPYLDGKNIPTMGVGFNLRVSDNLDEILTEIGFDIFTTNSIEQEYIGNIRSETRKTYTQEESLWNNLDAIMAAWAGDARVTTHNGKDKRTEFKLFDNENEIANVFDRIVPKYESRVDTWITANGLNIARYSFERAALVSLAYNSVLKNGIPELLGNHLAEAIKNGNRAEAWYEIRYQSNKKGEPGVAKRRFFESELFGLYNDPENVTFDDAEQIYKMLQAHRTSIATKEALFGYAFDGTPGTIKIGARTVIDAANWDYDVESAFQDGKIDTLEDSLKPARTALLVSLRARYQNDPILLSELEDEYFKATDIYLNPAKQSANDRRSVMAVDIFGNPRNSLMIGMDQTDVLVGGDGDDVLLGESGNDWLIGGRGNDLLYGGEGNDTYIIDAGDGTDTIEDKQGNNQVILNGKLIDLLIRQADGSLKSPDGAFFAEVQGTDLVVTDIATGTSVILNKDFEDGDFGIHLRDAPANPGTTNTIYGDRQSVYNPPQYDQWFNEITNYNVVQPGKNDLLYDSSADDRIEGGGGNDDIWAENGGNDHLLGGDGQDQVAGKAGNDLIEGGSDSDIVAGGLGNDQVFGETAGEMSAIIAAGEIAPNIDQRGDLVIGGEGDDYLYGSDSKDVFFGGAGHELIVGGGGNDIIYGEWDCTLATRDWTAEVGPNYAVQFTNMNILESGDLGNDVIYAGTGNDVIGGGAGNDEIDAGEGEDYASGETGDDSIYGGGGADYLGGDAPYITSDLHGNDYIDGGSGNDRIWGEGKSDTLFGGDGNDSIFGDDAGMITGGGDDYLDGEAGNDILIGGMGNDTIFGGADGDELYGDGSDIAETYHGNDYLDGEDGNDVISGEGGDDTLVGGAGTDQIFGGSGNDDIYGDDGDDQLQGGAGNDYIEGGTGNNAIWGEDGDDTIFGGDGINQLVGGLGDDYIEGGVDSDTVLGDDGEDTIYGNEGYDVLYGNGGNDYLDGGFGNDILSGGLGADRYVFEIGGGQDTIDDWSSGDPGADTVEFGEGISSSDLALFKEGNNLKIAINGTTDSLSITNWFGSTDYRVGQFEFADGTVLTSTQLESLGIAIAGTAVDDVLLGTSLDDLLYGYEGNDRIEGGMGNDILDGGSGNDELTGDAGSDTYIFGRGYGQDYIWDWDGYTPESVDTLQFAADVMLDDVTFSRSNYDGDKIITINGTSDQVIVVNHDEFGGGTVDLIRFGDGTTINWSMVLFRMEGTSADDNIMITSWDDYDVYMLGYAGNDGLFANGGNDILDGGLGDDTLVGGDGNETYMFDLGGGQDTVFDVGGIDAVQMGTGVAVTDIVFVKDMNNLSDLIISIDGTDTLRIENYWEESGQYKIENIVFDNGTVWDQTDIEGKPLYIAGTSGDDEVLGSDSADLMRGFAGHDYIKGLTPLQEVRPPDSSRRDHPGGRASRTR